MDKRRLLQTRIDQLTAEQRVRRAWLDHYDAELAVLALELEVLDATTPRVAGARVVQADGVCVKHNTDMRPWTCPEALPDGWKITYAGDTK